MDTGWCAGIFAERPTDIDRRAVYLSLSVSALLICNIGVKSSWPMWQLDTRQLDPRDNSTLVTTQPKKKLDPRDNSTLVTTRPSWQLDPRKTRPTRQLDPRDNSTSCDNSTRTTRPMWQLDPIFHCIYLFFFYVILLHFTLANKLHQIK